jgi:hypothetical protein
MKGGVFKKNSVRTDSEARALLPIETALIIPQNRPLAAALCPLRHAISHRHGALHAYVSTTQRQQTESMRNLGRLPAHLIHSPEQTARYDTLLLLTSSRRGGGHPSTPPSAASKPRRGGGPPTAATTPITSSSSETRCSTLDRHCRTAGGSHRDGQSQQLRLPMKSTARTPGWYYGLPRPATRTWSRCPPAAESSPSPAPRWKRRRRTARRRRAHQRPLWQGRSKFAGGF